MDKFFVGLYRYFCNHKIFLYTLLASLVAVMAFFALQVKFDEDVTNFFPDNNKENKHTALVFNNLKVKDKIIVLFSANDSLNADPDLLIEASEQYLDLLEKSDAASLIKDYTVEVGSDGVGQAADYIYGNLPILLTDSDYARLDSLTQPAAIKAKIESDYNTLVSPMGVALKDIILRDPLGLGNTALAGLQNFGNAVNYNIYSGHIFSDDMSKMVIMFNPVNGSGSTGKNEKLVTAVEDAAQKVMEQYKDVSVESFGGPMVAVYNARQIKSDTMVTLTVALLIIVVFISMAFRNRWAMLLISLPVFFGALFALSIIYFISGSMSAIAIGAGAAVFGIAMSYSIHVLSHRNHTKTIEQVISELAYPLTIGSFTTIGAFLGLIFTSSKLLRDFGLFAALALIGTTIFCLVFLPHMLSAKQNTKPNKILSLVERINSYRYDKNRWIVGAIGLVLLVTFFFYNDVRFDSDMLHLSYEPKNLKAAELKINRIFNQADNKVIFVSASNNADSALADYTNVYKQLKLQKENGEIQNVVSAADYLIPLPLQKERIERWQKFWTPEKQREVMASIRTNAARMGFAENSFDGFESIISGKYEAKPISTADLSNNMLFRDWCSSADSVEMMLTQVSIDKSKKEHVYSQFKHDNLLVILDRAHFSQQMASTVNDDFNLILWISSALIFLALLISYGRIELALMSFLPMALSWVIILGLMAILGIEFNIVNIILSTFIFGIGDDFSIFIMDGLQQEYSTGRKMLASHKTAIFFSAFTTVVGMGAMVFAKHPALQSISFISIVGMAAVVMIAYTVQPILFRIFISNPAKNGNQPYTLFGFFHTVYLYSVFVTGCAILQTMAFSFLPLPISKKRKKYWFHYSIYLSVRFIVKAIFLIKKVYINESKEKFEKPAVIIANHQSFIDIVLLLGLYPKLIMVTNGWVWNSPFFGRIVRYAGFCNANEGYESLVDSMRDQINNGYSVVVFPEGTRSENGSIARFHKGAFFLAEKMKLDIIPVVFFGNGLSISKRQPLLVKSGLVVTKILKRISPDSKEFGEGYKCRAKAIRHLYIDEHEALVRQYGNTSNTAIYNRIISGYIYKGPVLEWYMRVKINMEKRYKFFNEIIPYNASVTDIGCGYGPLSFMLSMVSPERKVLGIDYDEEKIAVANHSFTKCENLEFVYANALEYDYPNSDVFVLNDILHYLPCEQQRKLLEKCFSMMNAGGMVIVRDGDMQKQEKHRVTRLTEKFSTKILKFNKTEGELCFTSTDQMRKIAEENDFKMHLVNNDSVTSNTIYIFSKA